MAKFLAIQIKMGKITIEQVPAGMRDAVQAELEKL